ncbi:MAG: D-aminoacyl-tRNA deacylase [Nitrospinales bacterium]
MKLVLQRVLNSSVHVDGREIARISRGLTILFGAEKGDTGKQAEYLAEKTLTLRIFPDLRGKMNRSCLDIGGEILVVSQFTLAGDCSKGRRPGFDRAAPPDVAENLYRLFIERLAASGIKVAAGKFAADMRVDIQNDGPVTFILER